MKQSTIQIDDFNVIIKEISPKGVATILANAKEIFGGEDLDVAKFITEKYDLAVDLTKDFIIMPDGKNVDELGFSDIDLIVEEFKKVNESFLEHWLTGLMALSPVQKANLDQPTKV